MMKLGFLDQMIRNPPIVSFPPRTDFLVPRLCAWEIQQDHAVNLDQKSPSRCFSPGFAPFIVPNALKIVNCRQTTPDEPVNSFINCPRNKKS